MDTKLDESLVLNILGYLSYRDVVRTTCACTSLQKVDLRLAFQEMSQHQRDRAFSQSTWKGNIRVAEILLQAGVGRYARESALLHTNSDIACLVLEYGVRKSMFDLALPHWSCNARITRMLLEVVVSQTVRDKALIRSRCPRCVRLLLKAGVSQEARDSALRGCGIPEVARLLLKAGVSKEVCEHALRARYTPPEVTRLLLKAGTSQEARDTVFQLKHFDTMWEPLRMKINLKSLRLLLKAGVSEEVCEIALRARDTPPEVVNLICKARAV